MKDHSSLPQDKKSQPEILDIQALSDDDLEQIAVDMGGSNIRVVGGVPTAEIACYTNTCTTGPHCTNTYFCD